MVLIRLLGSDGVRYHLSTPTKKTTILLSIDIRCWNQLVQYGAQEIMKREYGDWISPEVEPDYVFSLLFEVDRIPTDPGECSSSQRVHAPADDAHAAEQRAALIRSVALLKRNALAAPFERAFAIQKSLEANPPSADAPPRDPRADLMAIDYRPEEAIYVIPSADRVTVVFSTIFREDVDMVYGRVFLQVRRACAPACWPPLTCGCTAQEFVDARRRPAIQTAPQILYSNREPPREISHIPGLAATENMGYVTFGAFRPTSPRPLVSDSRALKSCSLDTLRPQTPPSAPSRGSNFSATTCTITSSAPRPTSVLACGPGRTSFSRSSIARNPKLQTRKGRRRGACEARTGNGLMLTFFIVPASGRTFVRS